MTNIDNKKLKNLRKQSNLVRGGTYRSEQGETSEAIFMNSGYVFKDAEQAESRFKGLEEGYLYSRYGNPTVTMFEEIPLSNNSLRIIDEPKSFCLTLDSVHQFANFSSFTISFLINQSIVIPTVSWSNLSDSRFWISAVDRGL